MAKQRTPTGGRNIPGGQPQGAKPAGSSQTLKLTQDVKTRVPGPSMSRQPAGTVDGGGVTINSQPVK